MTDALTSDRRLTAPEINANRIAASLAFHCERLEWLAEEQPVWSDGVSVTKADIRAFAIQSREAIRLLEQGCFVAGGDA